MYWIGSSNGSAYINVDCKLDGSSLVVSLEVEGGADIVSSNGSTYGNGNGEIYG